MEKKAHQKYFLSTQYFQTLVNHKTRHKNKGNGFVYNIVADDEIANTIVLGEIYQEDGQLYFKQNLQIRFL